MQSPASTQNPANNRNLVRCPNCSRVLGADVAGLSMQRTHDYEWIGLMIQIRCRCGQVMSADPEVLSKVLTLLSELFPRFASEQRAAVVPVEDAAAVEALEPVLA